MSDRWEEDIRERLEKETRIGAGIGDGWWPAVCHAAWLLDRAYPGWVSEQIKEKFGGLRFYAGCPEFRAIEDWETDETYDKHAATYTDEFFGIVNAAESACVDVCEICGDNGKLVGSGWVHTLCPKHAAKYEKSHTMRGLADA